MTQHYGNSLKHFGIPGMKWGIRRYQNKDGTLTPEGLARVRANSTKNEAYQDDNPEITKLSKKKAGIVEGKEYDIIKKGSKINRIANSGEKIDKRRKYASLTTYDKQSYGEMFDMLGLDMNKPISDFEYEARHDLKVKHYKDVVKDLVTNYGDTTIKQLYDNDLLQISTYARDPEYAKNESPEEEITYNTYKLGENWMHDNMEKHISDLSKKYVKEGYDAIVDPEDSSFSEYPIVLLQPVDSIKLSKEIRWDEKYGKH